MISLSCLRNGHLSFTTPLYVREREAGRSLFVMASKLWNSLPLKLRTSHLISVFKHSLYWNFLSFQERHVKQPLSQNCSFYKAFSICLHVYVVASFSHLYLSMFIVYCIFFLKFLDFSYVIMLIFNFLYFLNICIFVINSILHPVGEDHKFINVFPLLWVTLIKQSLIDWLSSVSLTINIKENFNHQKLRKIAGGKKVYEPYIWKKIFQILKREFLCNHILGSNFRRLLILLCSYNIQRWYFNNWIRKW